MAIVPSDCLGCGLGVDSVTGLPGALLDPNGNLACGAAGLREKCEQNYLGVVAQAGYSSTTVVAIAANTDTYVTDGANPYAITLSWTNPYTCSVRLEPDLSFGIQGVGMALNTQSVPSRIEYQESTNMGPFAPWVAIPFTPTMTAPGGWQGETKSGVLATVVVPPGGTFSRQQRGFVRSSVACSLAAVTAGIVFRGWVIS
jgi:hypothetical protein